MTLAQHLALSNEHYTPAPVIEAARAVMGGIDLDPASCAVANETVKALAFFTKDDDGLGRAWGSSADPSRVWLNPPGGSVRWHKEYRRWALKAPGDKVAIRDYESHSLVWWTRLIDEYRSGRVREAVFLAFTLEMIRLSQHTPIKRIAPEPVVHFHRCYPRERLRFGGDGGNQPTHANVIAYLPPRDEDRASSFERFERAFSQFGICESGKEIKP